LLETVVRLWSRARDRARLLLEATFGPLLYTVEHLGEPFKPLLRAG
jgi:hypothetical protein